MSELNKESILKFLKDHRAELTSQFGVQQIGLFGSFASGLATPKSDLDFLVEIDEPNFDKLSRLQDFLEDHFHRSVDLTRLSQNIQTPFRRRASKQAVYV